MTTDPLRALLGCDNRTDDRMPYPEMDLDRFDRLMAIAGATHARELLFRLHADLENVQDRLAAALVPPHWADLRSQTHILVALAGAVGAVRLQHLAGALNALAHSADDSGLPGTNPALMEDLGALIGFVADHLARTEG